MQKKNKPIQNKRNRKRQLHKMEAETILTIALIIEILFFTTIAIKWIIKDNRRGKTNGKKTIQKKKTTIP